MPHDWKCWSSGWTGLWAAWSAERCPCPWQKGWMFWSLKILSSTNPSVIQAQVILYFFKIFILFCFLSLDTRLEAKNHYTTRLCFIVITLVSEIIFLNADCIWNTIIKFCYPWPLCKLLNCLYAVEKTARYFSRGVLAKVKNTSASFVFV